MRRYKTYNQVVTEISNFLKLFDLTLENTPLELGGYNFKSTGWQKRDKSTHKDWFFLNEKLFHTMKMLEIRGFMLVFKTKHGATRYADFSISN